MKQPHASFLEKGRGRLIGTLEDDDECKQLQFRPSELIKLYVQCSMVIGWSMMMMIMEGGGEQWPQAPHRRPIFLARLGGQPCPLSAPGTDTT